jgi:hypothetical protein
LSGLIASGTIHSPTKNATTISNAAAQCSAIAVRV